MQVATGSRGENGRSWDLRTRRRSCSFHRQSLPVNPPGFGFSRPFRLSTRPTTHGGRPHIALRLFIPPLLLRCRPDFFNTTIPATKGLVLVIATLNKVRQTIAGRGPQPGGRDCNGANRTIYGAGVADPGFLSDPPQPVRLDFLTALLVAFHGGPVMSPWLRPETTGNNSITTLHPSATLERARSAALDPDA